MATVDMSTRVAARAAKLLTGARAKVRTRFPLGPMKAGLTPRETLDAINGMTPEQRVTLADTFGVDELLAEIRRLEDASN